MDHVLNTGWSGYHVIGPKLPLKLKEIWAVRIRLQMANRVRDLVLFDLGLDSKLRGCDLVRLRIGDVTIGRSIRSRCMVVQQKTWALCSLRLPTPARNRSSLGWKNAERETMTEYSSAAATEAGISLCGNMAALLMSGS
jgi:hypothetical protein